MVVAAPAEGEVWLLGSEGDVHRLAPSLEAFSCSSDEGSRSATSSSIAPFRRGARRLASCGGSVSERYPRSMTARAASSVVTKR